MVARRLGELYVAGQPVHRVEFEFGRQALRDFDVDTPAHALSVIGDLWRYAACEWLTHRTPTLDATRSRWPISDQWLDVQEASLRHRAVGLVRLRETRRHASIASLMPGLTGYLVSLAALTGAESIDDTVRLIGGHLRTYEVTSRTPFAERVARRTAEFDAR